MAQPSEKPLTAADVLEIAQAELVAAAVDLRRGGQRGDDSHVLVQRSTWERFAEARFAYGRALDHKVQADAEYQRDVDSRDLENLPGPAEDSGELPATNMGDEP